MRLTMYHSHESNDEIRPVWLAIDFDMNGVPWTQKSLYVDVNAYETKDIYDFMDDIIGCSVYLEELFADPEGRQLGFNLNAIFNRLRSSGLDPTLIERFIVQVCDMQEVLECAKEMFL